MAGLERHLETSGPRRLIFYIGAAGLLTMIAVETLAVVGRHIGLPLIGAIELMQAAILVSACAAVVFATLEHAHATVHLLVDRLNPKARAWLARLAALLSAAFFVCLAVGAIWLAVDFWDAYEHSELLHIPFRPLRVLTALAVASVAGIFCYRMVRTIGERSA